MYDCRSLTEVQSPKTALLQLDAVFPTEADDGDNLKLWLFGIIISRGREGTAGMEAAAGGVRDYGTMSPAVHPHRRRGLTKAAVVVIIPVLALTATLAALVLDSRSAAPRIAGLSRCRCERSVHQ